MSNAGRSRVASPLSIVAVALTAFLFLGLLPQGASHAQTSTLPPVQFPDVVLFATNSVRIDHHAQILAGHVVVNNASPGLTLSPGVELGIDKNVVTPGGYAIAAHRIDVAKHAVVDGNAFYNTLTNDGTINGTLNTPLPPLPIFAPLPEFQVAAPGAVDVTVPDHQTQTLAPGNYRDITVEMHATLRLSAGTYNFRRITMDKHASLLVQGLASGTADIRVLDQVLTDQDAVIGPDDGDPLKAAKIIFYVAFASGPTLTPAAVSVGKNSTLKANVYAPNGTLSLGADMSATGAFLARDVDVEKDVQIDLETFFSQQSPVITSGNSATFAVGQPGTFTVTATGVPAPSITIGGVALPPNVTFLDNGGGNGTLSGTPASGTVGSYAITFTATNAAGSTPPQNFTLTVIKGPQTITFTSAAPSGATVGGPTYTVTATATSGLPVSFTIDASASAVCTIAGSTVSFIGAGTCVINANQPGDASYNPAPQVQQSFAVGKGSQAITFTSVPPAGAVYQGPTYTVTATATSGLTVVFTIDASASTVCSIAGSTVSFIGAGTCVINANQPGDANWNPAPQVQQSFAVAKASQSITFTSAPPAMPTVGGPTYTVTATATSGLTVIFTIDASASTVCSIAGSTVSFIGNGTCVINANQPGDANYDPAPQVQQSFTVKSAQTITFTSSPPAMPTVGGPTYLVTATATSGLTVIFTIDPSASTVCSIAGSTVSFIGAGTCVINANQPGDASYYPAPQVQQSFGVKHAQTITFTSTAPTAAVYQGPTYTVTATATSGLTVTFTIDASATSVCSVVGSTVSFNGTALGTCVINANQGGNATFYPAPQVQQSFTVGPKLDPDPYAVVGNTQLVAAGHSAPTTPFTADANGIVTNDDTPAGFPITVTAVTGAATTGGGSITIDASGAFTYTPPVGQSSGSDTYVYTGTAGGVSRTGTITFNIANIVWYVDNTSTGSHDGRSNTPFTHMGNGADGLGTALAGTGPAAGAFIYVHKGSGTTTGAYTFKPNQTLIGAGATLTVDALTVAGNAANTPTLGGTQTLDDGATVAGIDMSTGTADALVGTGITVTSVTVRDIATTSGKGINWSGVSSPSTVTVNNVTSTTGNAVDVTSSGATDFTFNDVTSTTGTAVKLITASGDLSFHAVNANGATTGISVVGASGSFAVNGTGTTTGSGGTIQNSSSRGAEFVSASNVTLRNMTFTNNGTGALGTGNPACTNAAAGTNTGCQAGIHLQSVTGATLTNLDVTDGNQIGINGHTVSNLVMSDLRVQRNGDEPSEENLQFFNLTGTSSLTGTNVIRDSDRGIEIQNSTGTLNFTLTGTTIDNTVYPAAGGNQGFSFHAPAGSNANMTVVATGNTFARHFSFGFQATFAGTSVGNVTLGAAGAGNNNTFTDNGLAANISGSSTGTVTFAVVNNQQSGNELVTSNQHTTPFSFTRAGGAGDWTGTVSGNTIGGSAAGDTYSGCYVAGCTGLEFTNNGTSGTYHVTVTDNEVNHVSGNGIAVFHTSGGVADGNTSAIVTGNTVQNPDVAPGAPGPSSSGNALHFANGDGVNDTGDMCLEIGGAGGLANDLNGQWANDGAGATNLQSIRLRLRTTNAGSFRIRNYAPDATPTDAEVNTFVASQNNFTGAGVTVGINRLGAFTNPVAGGPGVCP